MHITELRVRNFRNFVKAKFVFEKGVNTLIGENGSGKTNALHALRLLLDESLERNAVYLKETDFCRDIGQWRGHWIVISADFSELDTSEGCQLLRHNAGHMDASDTGTYTFFFRPKGEVRRRLFELSQQDDGTQEYLGSLTVAEYEPVLTGRATGDFLDDDIYFLCAGNPNSGEFPNPDDDDQNNLGVRMQPVYQEVACTFVRALRDVISELRSYRGNPLLTLLRGMETDIAITDAHRIAEKVKALNADISTLEEIKKLASGIEVAIQKAVGNTYGPSVTIESALPDEMEKLLQKLSILVGDSVGCAYRGEIHEQGLGGANLIYLALKLLEYESKLSSDRVAHFFLIEEPEAHIHTHIQKSLFSNLPTERTQVIVSTHSTHISSAAKISSVNVLARRDDHADVYQPANGLSKEATGRLERYLDAVRSTLLFAKAVLLVEGDAEQILIPAMLRAVFGVSADEIGFSIVSMSSAFFEHVAVVFSDKRIQRPCAIITDLDKSLIDLPDNSAGDTEEQKRARAAQESGQLRRESLKRFTSGNKWLRGFYATHTFEVDFIHAGNSYEVIAVLPTLYQNANNISASTTRLESEDASTTGREILRLANKAGKGWFALLLAEKLFAQTYIPRYILQAVAFACHSTINEHTLRRIAEFRINEVATIKAALPSPDHLRGLSHSEVISTFRTVLPTDDLSEFCTYLEKAARNDTAESAAG